MAAIAVGRKPVRVSEISRGQEVAVAGRLDVDSVDEVRLALHEILDQGVGDLLLHLAQAEVHDATGLGVIVGVHHRARRVGRRLVLVDVSPRLDRLLCDSRLHRALARGPVGEEGALGSVAETVMAGAFTVVPGSETGIPCAEAVAPFAETVVPFTE